MPGGMTLAATRSNSTSGKTLSGRGPVATRSRSLSTVGVGKRIVAARLPRSPQLHAHNTTTQSESHSGSAKASMPVIRAFNPISPPSVEQIALASCATGLSVPLPYTSEEYCNEVATLRCETPQIVWDRQHNGKPDKVALGPHMGSSDWDKYRIVCPKIVDTAEAVLRSFQDQHVQVAFGDVLDYRGGSLLGWHQDSMDLSRHTFTIVLTLYTEGEGRFEWRRIGDSSLGDVVSSAQPARGDLVIHGLLCNNLLAHRAFWDTGRRLTLVLFCRSDSMTECLREHGMLSQITMRNWWSKDMETQR